jgi:ABC-type transporter MlaC component
MRTFSATDEHRFTQIFSESAASRPREAVDKKAGKQTEREVSSIDGSETAATVRKSVISA